MLEYTPGYILFNLNNVKLKIYFIFRKKKIELLYIIKTCMIMDKCIAILKSGPRKGKPCNANKKAIDIIDRKDIPHCNRHRIKSKQKYDGIDILTTNLGKSLKIHDNILEKLDNQLDELFNEYKL